MLVEELERVEVFDGDGARGAGVGGIVGVDRAKRLDGLISGIEAEQALAFRNEFLEAGALRDDRAARGEIAGGAVAEPSGARARVDILGDGEFAARTGNVGAVAVADRATSE